MSALYKDRLVEVTDAEIVFRHYYFPSGEERRVALSEVEAVRVDKTSWRNRYRIWGSGDNKTWSPQDGRRPDRDRIFVASLTKASQAKSLSKKSLCYVDDAT